MRQEEKTHVLVVDDEPALRELLVDVLSSNGKLAIESAGSGKEAMDIARRNKPDILVTDLSLGDCSGLDVMENLRNTVGEVPSVVITGRSDVASFSEASRYRPIELMTKPLNLDHLQETIAKEATRQTGIQRTNCDVVAVPREEMLTERRLRRTCGELTGAYRSLSEQIAVNNNLIRHQYELISAKNDDDVFRSFFQTFVRESGAVFGAALVCDSEAQLRVVGRFGVPGPDSLEFCHALSEPLIENLLANPQVQIIEPCDEIEAFDPTVRRFLPGVTVLAIPLIPEPGEMIGVIILYRKGEQPFEENDIDIAERISYPTAVAVRRND